MQNWKLDIDGAHHLNTKPFNCCPLQPCPQPVMLLDLTMIFCVVIGKVHQMDALMTLINPTETFCSKIITVAFEGFKVDWNINAY